MKKIFKLFLVLLWMGMIFYFSSQNSSESSSLSSSFIATIYKFFTNSEISDELLHQCSFFVRKLAHFSVYFILGILVLSFVGDFKIKHCILLSLLICVLYSISDEFHQTFISGRSGELRDVLIDSSGSLCGISIFYLIRMQINNYLENKRNLYY